MALAMCSARAAFGSPRSSPKPHANTSPPAHDPRNRPPKAKKKPGPTSTDAPLKAKSQLQTDRQPNDTPQRRERRRKRRRQHDAVASPEHVVARAARAEKQREQQPALLIEAPLTPDEVASFRRHFRFLRDHRRLLKLKLNAQEDLLVNGARQPEHRGVCQHLLAKVEYSRVAAAAPLLDGPSRCRLLEGILAFTHELPYVLLYLESLRDTGHRDATSALTTALTAIDFNEVSEGQMRRVLELVVETFPEGHHAQVLFDLFRSSSFRRAFEATRPKLPAALLEAVLPLRAISAYAAKGRVSGEAAERVAVGLRWLLRSDAQLEGWPAAVRERLILRALELALDPRERAMVERLVLSTAGASRQRLGLAWVRWLLSTGELGSAQKHLELLSARTDAHSRDAEVIQYWLRAMNSGHRVGSFALLARPAIRPSRSGAASTEPNPHPPQPQAPRRLEAVWLKTLQRVWLRLGEADAPAEPFERLLQVHQHVRVPSVAECIEVVTSKRGGYCAVLRRGEALSRRRCQLAPLSERVEWAKDGSMILLALGRCGVALADVSPRRFELDTTGRLWLTDLWGAHLEPDPSSAHRRAFELAHQWCQQLLTVEPQGSSPTSRLDACVDESSLLAALTELTLSPAWFPSLPSACQR